MSYTFTDEKRVTIGESTKKSDFDASSENTDWLKELEIDLNNVVHFKEYGYDGNDLSTLDIYTDSEKGTPLWDIDYAYSEGNLSQVTILHLTDSVTRTFAYSYTGDNLTSITKTVS